MIQAPLEVYRIDMKYIRNLHNIDNRVLSVFLQIGKDECPFLGVIIICNEHKYCVPLSKSKKKHEKMRDKIDFKKIVYNGGQLGYGVYQVTKVECERGVLDALKAGYISIGISSIFFKKT